MRQPFLNFNLRAILVSVEVRMASGGFGLASTLLGMVLPDFGMASGDLGLASTDLGMVSGGFGLASGDLGMISIE